MQDTLTKPSARCKLFRMTSLHDYVSQTEAAEILGVDGSTVSRWSRHGRIEVKQRVGYTKLYARSEVEALKAQLQAGREEAKSA